MNLGSINIRILYFFFLLFHTYLINPIISTFSLILYDNANLNSSLYLEMTISCFFYLVAYLYIKPTQINLFLASAITISLFSLFIGLYNEWYLLDIIGDSYRYVAPILGFTVGLKLLSKVNKDEIISLIKYILFTYILLFIFSSVNFFYSLFFGQAELFTYSQSLDIEVYPIIFLFLYLSFISNPFHKISILFLLVALVFIVSMLTNLSKANFLLVSLYLIIPIFLIRSHIMNTFLILLIGSLIFVSFSSFEERISSMVYTINDFDINDEGATNSVSDTSTEARLIEFRAVINSFSSNILLLFTGHGNGALLNNLTDQTGIAPENFRENGGLHNIHIENVSLLFRNGLVGLFFYLYWQLYILKKSLYGISDLSYRNSSIYIFNLAIAIQIFGMIVIAFTNASFYGKQDFGLISAMVIIIFNLRKNNE